MSALVERAAVAMVTVEPLVGGERSEAELQICELLMLLAQADALADEIRAPLVENRSTRHGYLGSVKWELDRARMWAIHALKPDGER